MDTVHGDDITIGGERSAVECLVKMMARRYEIKKQVIGDDAHLEKSGRIIKWERGGITSEADRRHVREMLNWFWGASGKLVKERFSLLVVDVSSSCRAFMSFVSCVVGEAGSRFRPNIFTT